MCYLKSMFLSVGYLKNRREQQADKREALVLAAEILRVVESLMIFLLKVFQQQESVAGKRDVT